MFKIDHVATGGGEPHDGSRRLIEFPGMVTGHCDSGRLNSLGQTIEFVLLDHLEPQTVESIGRGRGEDQGVMLVFIPSLEVGLVGGASRLDQPDDLHVVGQRQLEIGNPNLGVGEAKYSW
jgi:hypothetical protein